MNWGETNVAGVWRYLMSSMFAHRKATGAFQNLYDFDAGAQFGFGLYPASEMMFNCDGLLLVPGAGTAAEVQPAGFGLAWLVEDCDGLFRPKGENTAELLVGMARSQPIYGVDDSGATLDFAALLGRLNCDLGLFK